MGPISLSSIRKRVVKKPPLIAFYGVAGVGKTTLALEFPGAVLMRTAGEDAPSDIDPDEFPEAARFSDVIDALGVLANEEHAFQTLVLDSLEGLEELVWSEACARNGWKSIEDAGFGKGYVAADSVWSELLSGILYLRAERNMTVILIAHSEISRFDSPTTDPYSRYGINLHKRALATIVDAADLIGFINYRVTLKSADAGFNKKVTHGEGGGIRVIHVEERPGFVAKNRFGMPPTIDYKKGDGYNSLSKYFPKAA